MRVICWLLPNNHSEKDRLLRMLVGQLLSILSILVLNRLKRCDKYIERMRNLMSWQLDQFKRCC